LRLRVPAEIAIGILVFTTGLIWLWEFWLYTTTGLIWLLIVLGTIGWNGWKETYKNIFESKIIFPAHSKESGLIELINPRLLSAEFAFMMLSFLVWVSLISIIRPMPIGWDDLWVYMNFPKMMALSGNLLEWAGMYTWQLITGTGFLFSNIYGSTNLATQAFYVNQLGWILAIISIICGLSLLFESKERKYLLALPIIFALVFYAMPMNIFQQAKDMKLDPALLWVSIAWLSILISGWKKEYSQKDSISFILIAWVIIWLAFTVKFTTLMLILWALWLIAYRSLSLCGFMSFFFLFLGIFTKLGLWTQLNVWMPSDPALLGTVSFSLLALGGIFWWIGIWKHGMSKWKTWIYTSLVFLLGVLIGLTPWIIKNTAEMQPWSAYKTIGMKASVMNSILSGSGGSYIPDYTKIYSTKEYEDRQKKLSDVWITGSGQSQNEDMGRYFGYDKWINNYLKLPANLTFQKNQAGEFTDITYIFLAFIPAIFLFARWRKYIFPVFVGITMLFLYFYYFHEATRIFFGNIFNIENLLVWYAVLWCINIAWVLLVFFGLSDKHEENEKIKEISILLAVYGFLFLISAFGIVWYGIVVYYLFFVLIGLAGSSFLSYTEKEHKDENHFSVQVTIALVFAIFILVYFLRSAFPHGWNNLKESSGYGEFKYGLLSQEEAIFGYRQDYTTSIASMNISHTDTLIEKAKNEAKTEKLKTLFASEKLQWISIHDFISLLFSLGTTKDIVIRNDAKNVANFTYKSILYPKTYAPELVNTGGIYRIGTFMTYLINENRKRYLDDSLIFSFDTFFYDTNPDVTVERMKKLGLKYLLVDLNAATIDKDPRHVLTDRFEKLLKTMRSEKLTLVDTDSICLRLAIDESKKWVLKTDDEFINLGGTNYESYRNQSGTLMQMGRWQKQAYCFNYILKKIATENPDTLYEYLIPIREAIKNSWADTDEKKLQQIFSQYIWQSWFTLFEIQ
jgi:hypothetical protein